MVPQILHLPDGQTFTVTPVFAGVGFKSHEMNTHHNAFPIGWTVVLHTEEEVESPFEDEDERNMDVDKTTEDRQKISKIKKRTRPFVQPSLQNDALFISSISNPSSTEFKPAASPTRQIAMMMWITLYWYFHQPKPSPYLHTQASKSTPDHAKPVGEWKIKIKREGVLRGRNLIPKLERMGLISSEDTAVGTTLDDSGESWSRMFVCQRSFWQIPGQLFLFTLQPNRLGLLSSFPGSPANSRPSSPVRGDSPHYRQNHSPSPLPSYHRLESDGLAPSPGLPPGPFYSTSHLPTYYPPPPLQYTFTGGIRHPLRPKPHRMGEIFYCRFIPSVGQYLSFRVASSSPKPVPYLGPLGPKPAENTHLTTLSDTSLLQMWMGKQRVSEFWGEYRPDFLETVLSAKHSFPVIGMWDGIPFGYFEIYWVKEDLLGQHIAGEAGDWDRGFHIIIGEEWARDRVSTWMSSLVHWCFMADYRTMNVCLEPRVDNAR
ncbi:Acyltransferase sidL [Cladobotryum mycophilum]|uniref:Acyltransferase sidL n=1 Tax=Cladobotryum mycophilum TaxID=491253 RepID=A0ABR0SB67_9HYPO